MLIPHGRRIRDLTAMEMLNFTYAHFMGRADEEGRRRIQLALAGRLGEHGGEIVDDPDLPSSLQGMEAPSWWRADDDPFADQHQLGGSDTSFYSGGL